MIFGHYRSLLGSYIRAWSNSIAWEWSFSIYNPCYHPEQGPRASNRSLPQEMVVKSFFVLNLTSLFGVLAIYKLNVCNYATNKNIFFQVKI